MAWHRLGDKPLSEPMMISLSTHICDTRPQWVKPLLGLLMMTSSNGSIFRVTFPFVWEIHRSSMNSPHKGQWRGAFMLFYLRLNKRLSEQLRCRSFETPSRSLWRHCNVSWYHDVYKSPLFIWISDILRWNLSYSNELQWLDINEYRKTYSGHHCFMT